MSKGRSILQEITEAMEDESFSVTSVFSCENPSALGSMIVLGYLCYVLFKNPAVSCLGVYASHPELDPFFTEGNEVNEGMTQTSDPFLQEETEETEG